jgi:hypothetical protein
MILLVAIKQGIHRAALPDRVQKLGKQIVVIVSVAGWIGREVAFNWLHWLGIKIECRVAINNPFEQ